MLSEVVRLAQRLMAIQAEPIWNSMQDREWDTAVWVSNSEKIRRELGWRPRHSFEQGFTETLGWFQSKPEILELYKRLSAG
jgi:dTDP-D-glucose 4,6-dehydratase